MPKGAPPVPTVPSEIEPLTLETQAVHANSLEWLQIKMTISHDLKKEFQVRNDVEIGEFNHFLKEDGRLMARIEAKTPENRIDPGNADGLKAVLNLSSQERSIKADTSKPGNG